MFRGAYQRKLLTILYSGGSNPLEIWDIQVKNGWTRRVKDEDMCTIVFEICGTNVATAFICSPPEPRAALGISLPFITMFIKNLKRYFTFEIQVLDDKQMRRRFRFSNYQSATKVRPFTCSVPLALKPGWNQMQLNLANFTMRAYGTNYVETQRVQIHANCRIRRVYFSDRLYAEEELPKEYRIHLNVRQAPQPPPQPEHLFSPTASGEKMPTLDRLPSHSKGPSSILKPSSFMKAATAALSEEEVTKTSFKSAESVAERSSLKEFRESVMRGSKSSVVSERNVTFDTGLEKVASKQSYSHKSVPHEETTDESSYHEQASVVAKKSDVEVTEDIENTSPGEVQVLEEGNAVDDENVAEDVAEQLDDTEQDVAQEVAEVLEESHAEMESPIESEFAESEPIPESDLEEPPSSPEPDTYSP